MRTIYLVVDHNGRTIGASETYALAFNTFLKAFVRNGAKVESYLITPVLYRIFRKRGSNDASQLVGTIHIAEIWTKNPGAKATKKLRQALGYCK